jgi:hypothetical protein
MNSYRKWVLLVALAAIVASVVVAQRGGRGIRRSTDDRGGVPTWSNEPGFEKDTFTFARIEYGSGSGRGLGRGGWRTDWPDADLNFSYRLQQLTSLKVNPEGKTLSLTDPELPDHPFIYIVEPGSLEFEDDEVTALRRYLLSGGFLMIDDFWGEAEYGNLYEQIKRVFPGSAQEPQELPLDHPIFHCVFDLKEKPQVPAYDRGEQSQYDGITWERNDARTPHYRAIFDDKGRMMVIICHNTDLGDGWEREGVYEYYFREFSEKKAYPLGINIVFYAMTH